MFKDNMRKNIISLLRQMNYLETGENKPSDSDVIWIANDLEAMNIIQMMMFKSKMKRKVEVKAANKLGYDLTHETHGK